MTKISCESESPLVAEVRRSRTAWLEQHGVPVSEEFARFATAVGNLMEAYDRAVPRIAELERELSELRKAATAPTSNIALAHSLFLGQPQNESTPPRSSDKFADDDRI